MNFIVLTLFLSLPFALFATEFERQEVINGVTIKSIKEKSRRKIYTYQFTIIDAPIEKVYQSLLMWDEHCNNEKRDKRKYVDKKKNCKFQNEGIVESKIIRNIKRDGYKPEENEIARYLVKRNGHQSLSFAYYDLIIVRKLSPDKYVVTQRTILDNEVKKYLDQYDKFDNVFDVMDGTFTLTKITDNKTKLEYNYVAETGHWLLNKGLMLGKLYDAFAKGTAMTVDGVRKGSFL